MVKALLQNNFWFYYLNRTANARHIRRNPPAMPVAPASLAIRLQNLAPAS